MAEYQVVYWHEFPSMVVARGEGAAGRRDKASVQLPARFQEAIDAAAMRRKLSGTDAYLDGWVRSEWQRREGSPAEVAAAVAAEVEAEYSEERLRALIEGV